MDVKRVADRIKTTNNVDALFCSDSTRRDIAPKIMTQNAHKELLVLRRVIKPQYYILL